jgi:hypothetical protein
MAAKSRLKPGDDFLLPQRSTAAPPAGRQQTTPGRFCRRLVPVVVGEDHCGVCLDGSVSQCGHRTWKSLILKGFAVVRQVGEVEYWSRSSPVRKSRHRDHGRREGPLSFPI